MEGERRKCRNPKCRAHAIVRMAHFCAIQRKRRLYVECPNCMHNWVEEVECLTLVQ